MKTFAFLLIGIVVAVRAAQLQLNNVGENGLEGIYRPIANTSDYYFKFSVAIEKDTVVSSSEIILAGEVVPFVLLKVPLLYKNKRVINHMREKILLAARHTAAVYNKTENMPPYSELITSYNNLADEMNKAITDKKGSQVFFMIMYHSTIIGSAFRITIGAQESWEICEPSPMYTNGTGIFVCEQDVKIYMDTLYSKKEVKFRRSSLITPDLSGPRPLLLPLPQPWPRPLPLSFPWPLPWPQPLPWPRPLPCCPCCSCCCCDYWFCGWHCSRYCCICRLCPSPITLHTIPRFGKK